MYLNGSTLIELLERLNKVIYLNMYITIIVYNIILIHTLILAYNYTYNNNVCTTMFERTI